MLSSKLVRAAQAIICCIALTSCNSCERDFYVNFKGSGDLKRAPIFFDLNNIVVQVANYKAPIGPQGFDKWDRRLATIAKKDDAGGFGRLERTLYGEYEFTMRVAYFETQGLVAGSSFAGAEIDSPPDGQPLLFDFLGIAYRPDIDGILAFAQDETGPKGTPTMFANTRQAILKFTQTSTTLTLSALPIANFVTGVTETVIYSTPNAVDPTTPFKIGMGANNLNKGGRFYFDFLSLKGPDVEGVDEGNINAELGLAGQHFISAAAMLEAPMRNFVGAAGEVTMARANLANAKGLLEAAIAGADLEVTSHGDNAMKELEKAEKTAEQVANAIAQENVSAIKGIVKKIAKINDSLMVAGVNLCGYEAKNRNQIPIQFSP